MTLAALIAGSAVLALLFLFALALVVAGAYRDIRRFFA